MFRTSPWMDCVAVLQGVLGFRVLLVSSSGFEGFRVWGLGLRMRQNVWLFRLFLYRCD